MVKEIRFARYQKAINVHQRYISYNKLAPQSERDGEGNDIPYRASRVKIKRLHAYKIIQLYVSVRLLEQIKAVVPLALYLCLFQLLILKQDIANAWVITAGLLSVIIGLMLFMEGLKISLMPFGQTIGNILPGKSPLSVVLLIAFLLGIGVTFAEPAIGALRTTGAIVDVNTAPYLYALLNEWAGMLVLVVGMGVGTAAVLGTLRFLYGWSLKPLIYLTVIPTLGLTGHIMADPELSKMIGLAWDCGAITTGPVTVPLVLSLGIGIAAAAGKGRSSLSGFGIVTLASLFPIIGVEILALVISVITTPEEIIENAGAIAIAQTNAHWRQQTPWNEIIMGIRAIVPLVIFLFLVLTYILKERVRDFALTLYGITLCLLGMIIFNIGLSYGLANLGGQSGGLIPAAFTRVELVTGSPLYPYGMGILIAAVFAWLLGFGATLAEPALNALGFTVENLSNGAFKKSMLMYAVSIGVGTGIAIGVMKIIFSIHTGWLLIPGYLIALALTFFSTEEYVNIAWDSAGVTTGPVTVPLVLVMGLGFGDAVGAVEGFGILSMASVCPIISVMITGLWVRWKVKRRHELTEAEAAA